MTPAQAPQAFQAASLEPEAATATIIELSASNAHYESAVKSDSGSFTIMAETADTTPPEFPTGSTAPVQELTVTDDLNAALDWSSFQPTGFAFGGHVYPITNTGNSYSARVTVPDYRPDVNKDWWVDVKITLDLTSGQAKWTFKTIDPETGEPPADALAGFLPVNDKELANGEGYVTFTIKVFENAAIGNNVDNEAKIYFDYNPAIITEKVSNIIVEPPQPVVLTPDITIDPANLDFGSMVENETSEQTIVFYNGGSSQLSINSLALPLEPFYVLDYTDVTPYAVLDPGSSIVVTVKFAPTTTGDFYDVIIVKSNDPDEGEVSIPLNGRGIKAASPQLSILPAAVGFGTVTINTEAYQDIIATNTGNSNLEIGTVSLTGTDPAFSIIEDGFSGKTLAPGSSATLRLGFLPAAEQAYSNSLNIPTNDPQNEQKQLELSGTGVPPVPDICSSKNQILFGNVIVGQGLERIVTIANAGGADLQIGDVSIAETESPFSLIAEKDNLSAVTLSPGESATLSILFAPEEAGTYNASLIIPSNDPDQNPLSISLSGQGQLTNSVQGIIVTGQDGITTIQVQDTLQMQAEVLPGSATNQTIIWSITGEEGIAAIDENGLLTALAPGIIEVKAEAEDGSGVAGYREITIEEADPLINDECFIATAAFGSKFTRPVVMLRSFRDQYLLTNAWGIAFVKFYYQHSPPVAALIADNQSLKMLVKVMLMPIIALVYTIYHPMLIIALLILLVAIFAHRLRRRYISTNP